jgi:nucleoside-diphosphate-sugar epimerase
VSAASSSSDRKSQPEGTLAGQKILVTGGSGFLGSHLCRQLLREGCTVHAISRRHRTSDGKLVPFVIRSLLADNAPKLSSGHVRADWIYVADVIDGFVKAATAPGIEGQTFDLGTGKLRSLRSLVTEIASVMNSRIEPQFGAVPDRPNEREWIYCPRPGSAGPRQHPWRKG